MTRESEQPGDIFKQLSEHFSSHRIISVIPVKGDPPDQYEITYTIPGMALIDGKKTQAATHVIEFSIPFGFPHFPPSCKPKSNIFHPDFDPAAICLGDFWEQNRSLPDLIIHIGRMISGEFYSTDNAFNEEAAIWFTEHQQDLPFSTALAEPVTSEEKPDGQIAIDTLDDSDLATSFDDLSLDRSYLPTESDSTIDISLLQLFGDQKNYFKLLDSIKNLPGSSDETEQLAFNAREAIDQADQYDKTAQQEEQNGNAELALEGYEKVADLVADFPNISAKIGRVRRSLELLKDVVPEPTSSSQTKSGSVDEFDTPELTSPKKKETSSTSPHTVKPVSHQLHKKSGRKNRVTFLILTLVLLAAGGGGVYFYISSQNKLTATEQNYSQCLKLIDAGNFIAAKNSCEIALQLGGSVKFLQQKKIAGLVSEIQKILLSEKLQQGLAGKVLVDGKYLKKAHAETLLHYKKLSNEGETLSRNSQWIAAAEKLQEAVNIAQKNSFIDTDSLADLTSRLHYAKLQTLLQTAAEKFEKKAWKEAIKSYTDALTYLKKLPAEVQQQYRPELQQNLEKSRFEELKNEADSLFAESDWQKATSFYQRVLTLGKTNDEISEETLTEISTNIERAKLYHAINSGNQAFSSGDWDNAILSYANAQSLLTENKDLLSTTKSDINIRKLKRIILQASIIKDRQTAKDFFENGNLQAAKISHEKLIHDINTSSFASDKEFLEMKTESSEFIQSLEHKIFLNGKQHYLESNFQTLFTTNYPAASPESLSQPVVTLVQESPEKILFKMQCTETGRGRPLALIMFYAFDKKSGTWGFSSGKLQE